VNFEVLANGRDKIIRGVDLSRTIGWVVDYVPVMVKSSHHSSLIQKIHSYKQQYMQIPNSGLGFNAVKYLSDDPLIRSQFKAVPRAEFNINYIPRELNAFEGAITADLPVHLISPGSELAGNHHGDMHADIIWPSYIHIEVRNGEYVFTWIARDNVYKKSTIESALSLWLEEIEMLADATLESLVEYASNDTVLL